MAKRLFHNIKKGEKKNVDESSAYLLRYIHYKNITVIFCPEFKRHINMKKKKKTKNVLSRQYTCDGKDIQIARTHMVWSELLKYIYIHILNICAPDYRSTCRIQFNRRKCSDRERTVRRTSGGRDACNDDIFGTNQVSDVYVYFKNICTNWVYVYMEKQEYIPWFRLLICQDGKRMWYIYACTHEMYMRERNCFWMDF